MKSGAGIVRAAWIMLGLLLIGSVAFELDKPTDREKPLATSFDPSGAAAFAELLRQDGYNVRISGAIPQHVPAEVLPVAFVERGKLAYPTNKVESAITPPPPRARSSKSPSSDDDEPLDTELAPDVVRSIVSHLKQGGNALILGYESELSLRTDKPAALSVSDPSGRAYHVVLPAGVNIYSEELAEADASLPAWLCDSQAFGKLVQVQAGRAVLVGEGEVAMNAFIDQGDNSKLLLDQVHLIAPKGTAVVLIDGAVGASASGLIDVLGPWAHGIELQVIFLCIVIVYSLGKRFGLADETRPMQRSSRDLLDGIADTYGRGRASKAGLQAVLNDADRAVRRHLKLPADAPVRKRNELLPAAAVQAMTACEHALMQELSPDQALALCRQLETELEVFLKRRTVSAKRRLRSVNSR